ncbi:MAG: YiiX/YebB-like N1pC/P60 family cysteine hydrolase [Coxiellaceae bacterium]|nr:YiiX/YebB-like N1pC/P60 family cysteine hydrolase [Coxiellaceae bacterium]
MISSDIFHLLKPTHYKAASQEIKSGDLLLCSGNGLVSDIIKKATDSAFSHVALILELNKTGQWLVLESVESFGVRCVTLDQGYLKNYRDTNKGYDGKMIVARHSDMAGKTQALAQLYEKAFALTGDLYSKQDIFKIASRITMSKIGIHENGDIIPHDNHYICSEYVYACYKNIGIDLPYDPLGFIAPADIAKLDAVKPVCQLAPYATQITENLLEASATY